MTKLAYLFDPNHLLTGAISELMTNFIVIFWAQENSIILLPEQRLDTDH